MSSTVTGPRHRARRARVAPVARASRRARGRVALAVGAVAVLAVLGVPAGGTFALWSTSRAIPAATVTSGTTGLTVNGQSAATITGLDATKLGPGSAVATTLTLANTGTTPLSVAVTQGTVLTESQSLAQELMVRVVALPPASCGPAATGGSSGRIPGFQSTATPVPIAAGASVSVCLVVSLDADAPATAQGGAVSFRLTVTGTQVAP